MLCTVSIGNDFMRSPGDHWRVNPSCSPEMQTTGFPKGCSSLSSKEGSCSCSLDHSATKLSKISHWPTMCCTQSLNYATLGTFLSHLHPMHPLEWMASQGHLWVAIQLDKSETPWIKGWKFYQRQRQNIVKLNTFSVILLWPQPCCSAYNIQVQMTTQQWKKHRMSSFLYIQDWVPADLFHMNSWSCVCIFFAFFERK